MQCDFDTVGTESPLADAETAQVIHAALTAAGVPAFTIALNNRKILDGLLDSLGVTEQSGRILRALDKIDKVGRDAVKNELLGNSDSPSLSPDQAERILQFVDEGKGGSEVLDVAEKNLGTNTRAAEGIANLRAILDLLDAGRVPMERLTLNLGLARGLDYYTGVVFETTVAGWERFGSIASGGRYDNLASLFTSRRLPGVGASIGLDRLLALMDEAKWLESTSTTAPVLVANFPGGDPATFARLAARLRAVGIGVEVYPDPIQLGKQLQYGSEPGTPIRRDRRPQRARKRGVQPPRPRHPPGTKRPPLARPRNGRLRRVTGGQVATVKRLPFGCSGCHWSYSTSASSCRRRTGRVRPVAPEVRKSRGAGLNS